MRVTGMAFEKKIVTAQYEHELLRVECAVTESEDPNKSLSQLIKFVQNRGCVLDQVGTETPAASTAAPTKKTTSAPPKETKKVKVEEAEVTATAEVVEGMGEARTTAEGTEVATEAVTTSEPETKSEPAAKAKKGKIKGTNYDRTNENHKKILGEVYDKNFPGWRAKSGQYVEASKKMEGKAFLDAEGLVLPEFVEAIKEIVSK